jgi:hypothetical protein
MGMRIVTGVAIERAGVVLAAVLGGIGMSTALAQGAGTVTVEVGECVNLKLPEERLACFERRVDEVTPQNRTAPAAIPPEARSAGSEPALPAPGGTPESARATAARPAPTTATPPRAEAQRRSREETLSSGRKSDSAESDEIVASVSALRQTVPNSYLITLDNGQVWRQTFPQWFPLQSGQRVTLRTSKWGKSYRLTVDELSGFIQVERVR